MFCVQELSPPISPREDSSSSNGGVSDESVQMLRMQQRMEKMMQRMLELQQSLSGLKQEEEALQLRVRHLKREERELNLASAKRAAQNQEELDNIVTTKLNFSDFKCHEKLGAFLIR